MRKRFLQSWTSVTFRAPGWTLVLAAALTLAAMHVILNRLSFVTDVREFLPEDLAPVATYNEVLSDFGSFHYVIAVFEATRPGRDVARREAALKELADQYTAAISRRRDLIQSVEHKRDAEADYYSPSSERRVVNLMTAKDWTDFENSMTTDSLERMSRTLLALMQIPEPGRPRGALWEDPFNVRGTVLERLARAHGPIDIPLRDGYILSEDGRMLLVVIRPQKPPTDHQFSRELWEFLDQVRKGVKSRNAALWDRWEVRIDFIGTYVESQVAAKAVGRDLDNLALVSLAGIILLFLAAFRGPTAIVFMVLPLAAGIVWTLGLAALIYGRLTFAVLAICAVLAGLGVDFAVHIYNRFVDETLRGAGTRAALEKSLTQTGRSISTAALTAAAAFFALAVTSSPGIRELGIVGGVGILCCLLAVCLILPPLISLRARFRRVQPRPGRIASFGLARLATAVMSRPRGILILVLAATAYLAYQAREVTFSRDWSALKEQSNRYDRLMASVGSKFELPGPAIVAVVSGPTLQQALEANDQLYANLETAPRDQFSGLLSYDSLSVTLPSIRSQRQSRARLLALDVNALKQRMAMAVAASGMKPAVFAPFAAWLEKLTRQYAVETPLVDFEDENAPDVLRRLTQRYVVKSMPAPGLDSAGERTARGLAEKYSIITHIYPQANAWTYGPPNMFFRMASHRISDIEFTGYNLLMSAAIRGHLLSNLARAILVALVAIFALLLLHFHRIRLAFLGMMPVLLSLVWFLGIMRLADWELNVANVIVLPLLIGVSVNNTIHILQRFLESSSPHSGNGNQGDVETVILCTGRAVTVASLTVLIGFGALSLAHFNSLREIGLLTIMGVGVAMAMTLAPLPAILHLAGKRLSLSNVVGWDKGVERVAGDSEKCKMQNEK
ncbi:MAG: MMPL family transporter [Candidatus Sumerlaeota bacterium]|nr:MMPL family transporter [Candidatus Sumerlaeota bacterium]